MVIFFNHKFTPWYTNKLTKWMSNGGKILSVVGVALSIYFQIKQDVDEDRYQKEVREAKENILASFNKKSSEFKKHFNNALTEFLQDNYNSVIKNIDTQISDIKSFRQNRSKLCRSLEGYQVKFMSLITEIHDINTIEV